MTFRPDLILLCINVLNKTFSSDRMHKCLHFPSQIASILIGFLCYQHELIINVRATALCTHEMRGESKWLKHSTASYSRYVLSLTQVQASEQTAQEETLHTELEGDWAG